MRHIMFALILAIGGVLFWVVGYELWILDPRGPPLPVWIAWIIVIGIAIALAYIGYESYKVLRE